MKFITDDKRTQAALRVWSPSQPIVVAKHFFWAAGTSMQKSRNGLLQTLLYDIFRQQPGLIEKTCVERWPKRVNEIVDEEWCTRELVQVMECIAHSSDLLTKYCFFIDGLDEFEGDHVEFCQALRKLSTSPHIKLCVSSRPWNVFEDFFGNNTSSKLYIHELTANDIRSYVQGSLREHPRWPELVT
ncbi:hypothetical protein F5Y15DRAFT_107584 [Xylariaceae sp. FL0016]|nr:hypothetical protein F5Y15DRAFT_107584 [Xylariaceae sp. FL0016]